METTMMQEVVTKDYFHGLLKPTLVNALRNCSLGPGNLSRQDKVDLVDIAWKAYSTMKPDRASALVRECEAQNKIDRKL